MYPDASRGLRLQKTVSVRKGWNGMALQAAEKVGFDVF